MMLSGELNTEPSWPLARNVKGYVRLQDIVHSHSPGPFSESDPRISNYDPVLRSDPATNLLSLQAEVIHGPADVRLIVDNAFDSHPNLQRDVDAHGSPLAYAYTFKPRTVGMSANWRFR